MYLSCTCALYRASISKFLSLESCVFLSVLLYLCVRFSTFFPFAFYFFWLCAASYDCAASVAVAVLYLDFGFDGEWTQDLRTFNCVPKALRFCTSIGFVMLRNTLCYYCFSYCWCFWLPFALFFARCSQHIFNCSFWSTGWKIANFG